MHRARTVARLFPHTHTHAIVDLFAECSGKGELCDDVEVLTGTLGRTGGGRGFDQLERLLTLLSHVVLLLLGNQDAVLSSGQRW